MFKIPAYLKDNHGARLLLAGVGMTLGFAPFNAWPIALLSLAYWVWVVREAVDYRQAVKASFLWALSWQVSGLYWLPRAFYLDADRNWLVGIVGGVPAMLAVALWGVLGVVLVALAAYHLRRMYGVNVFYVALPFLWVAMEVVKSLHQMGFPWFPLGAMWANWLWLAQGASVAGVWGLSFVLVGLAVVLSGRPKVGLPVAVLIVVLLAGAGAWRVAQVVPAGGNGAVLRVVQPDEQSALKWDPTYRWNYLRQVEGLTFSGEWQLVDAFVLPENAVPFYLEQEPEARAMLTRLMLPGQVLATGTIGLVDGPTLAEDRYYNRLSVLGAATLTGPGEVISHSGKVMLVPFGEYIPLRWVLDYLPIPGVRTLSQSRLDYTAATQPTLLDMGKAGKALPLVCYEAIFANYVGKHAKDADFLLNVTNDNWFTGTIALNQHAALARLRAIETGMPLVRAANTGITVVYDGAGREVMRLPVNEAALQDVRLPKKLDGTVWGRMWGR